MPEKSVWITLRNAAAWFAERGITVDRATLAAWIRLGVVVSGRRVYLAAQRVGRRWFVTMEGLASFLEAMNFHPPAAGAV